MANHWFRFKQFSITQANAAMKVTTDACIFGAWVSRQIKSDSELILDIGTGTGILTLQFLQVHTQSNVLAVEPDSNALRDARINFKQSPWAEKIQVCPVFLKDFTKSYPDLPKADVLFCNPPFFQNSLKGTDASRNRARHDSLTPEELIRAANELLSELGILAVIYPASFWPEWEALVRNFNWFPHEILEIQPIIGKPANRICGIFKREQTIVERDTLIIRDINGAYTVDFRNLLKPYYLFL